jgi:hypothetical protein
MNVTGMTRSVGWSRERHRDAQGTRNAIARISHSVLHMT